MQTHAGIIKDSQSVDKISFSIMEKQEFVKYFFKKL